MEHKLRDFLRKVSNRKKTEQQQNAETIPSTRRERNSLPQRPPRPLSSQTHGLKPSPAKQSLDTSSPPANLNSESAKQSVEQKPELPSKPVHSNTEPTSPRSPTRPVATSSNAFAKGQTEGWVGTTDTQNSRDSFPGHTNNDHSNRLAESVAHDYAAYQPMLSSTSAQKESQQTILGGDTSLMTDASQQRHNEDIANRNILANNSGHGSSVGSLVDMDLVNDRYAARKGSVGRQSIGSVGTNSIGGSNGGGSIHHSRIVSEQSSLNVESPSILKSHNSTRNNPPNRMARDEPHYGKRKGKTDDNNVSQANSTRDFSERNATRKSNGKLMDLRAAVMDGANDDRKAGRPDDRLASGVKERLHAKGVNIDNTVDVDKTTTIAPAVTHEVVQPTTHHIIKEEIHREIHNHEVYHRVLPVHETEVLPARHFVPNPEGHGLIEVAEDQLPDCTGVNQRWFIGEKETILSSRKPLPQVAKPKFAGEKTYVTPGGFERKETMIIHPPELEDMSNYNGPVQEVHFHHAAVPDGVHATNKAHTSNKAHSSNKAHASYTAQASKATDALVGAHTSDGQTTYEDEVSDRAPDVKRYSMKVPEKDLPNLPSQMVPPRSSSVRI